MHKIAIGLALCSTALSSAALARDNQTYVELGFGPAIANDFDIRTANDAETEIAVIDPDYGFDGQIVAGHDWGAFRIEVEGSYREFTIR